MFPRSTNNVYTPKLLLLLIILRFPQNISCNLATVSQFFLKIHVNINTAVNQNTAKYFTVFFYILYEYYLHIFQLRQGSRKPIFHLLYWCLFMSNTSWVLFWFVKAKLQKSKFLHSFMILLWKWLWFGLLHVKELWKNWSHLCLQTACILPCIRFTLWQVLHSLLHSIQCYIVALLSTRPEAEGNTVTSMTQDDKQKVVI